MTQRIRLDDLTNSQLDHLYNQLDALRQVARGYCPTCGRGDAAPTVTDWEQQRDRADRAEAALARVHAATAALTQETDEYATVHNPKCECEWIPATHAAITRVRAALDQPAPAAATQATDHQEQH